MGSYLIALALISITALSAGCVDTATNVNRIAEQVYSRSSFQDPLPPRTFESDGCSLWPDGNWLECCVQHDLSYWQGGTREARKDADLQLRNCVSAKGHPIISRIMFLGVRIGGVWWLPTPFRWGFGWNYPDSGPAGKPY
jgi:hypothetical protein